MSRLKAIYEEQLTAVTIRIAEIVTAYPDIIKVKSYSRNYNATNTSYQDFGPVSQEYRQLLEKQAMLANKLDEIEGTTGGTTLAQFEERY